MATKAKVKEERKGTVDKVIEAAADAAQELGAAASSFRQSWRHVERARAKGRPAASVVKRAAKATVRGSKKAWDATKRATKSATKAVTGTKRKTAVRRKAGARASSRRRLRNA